MGWLGFSSMLGLDGKGAGIGGTRWETATPKFRMEVVPSFKKFELRSVKTYVAEICVSIIHGLIVPSNINLLPGRLLEHRIESQITGVFKKVNMKKRSGQRRLFLFPHSMSLSRADLARVDESQTTSSSAGVRGRPETSMPKVDSRRDRPSLAG